MSNERIVLTPYVNGDNLNKGSLKSKLSKYIFHWPLFLLCLMACGGLAYLYVSNATPFYLVKSKIAIKDNKSEQLKAQSALEELNIAKNPKKVESEIEVLRSRQLIAQTIDQLQLWAKYEEKTGAGLHELYKESPLKVKILDKKGSLDDIVLNVAIKDAQHFLILRSDGSSTEASFKDVMVNSFGKWQLQPTASLPQYLGKSIKISLTDPKTAITNYQKSLQFSLNKDAPIIDLAIEDHIPERGKDILNTLTNVYKGYDIADKNRETQNTLRFLNERLLAVTGDLTDVEKDVEGYKSSIGLTDISSQSQYYLENVQSNDVKLSEVNVQLDVINELERYVRSSDGVKNIPATIGITDPGLTNLVDELTKMQLEKEKLLSITPETNPIFIPINRQINTAKQAIRETLSGIKSSLLASRRQLQHTNSRFESSIRNIPGQERKYVNIKRQQGIKESLYVYLLQKKEEIALSYASTITDARVVESAYYDKPVGIRRNTYAIALLLGLLIPVGILSGRAAMNNKILSKDDLEDKLSIPIIAELSQGRHQKPIIMLDRASQALGEQLRSIRTSILHLNQNNQRSKVTMFTSSVSGEGKSFVASNIATSLAISGRKTVILEMDLRRPTITKAFGLSEEHAGLSEYLKGEASLNSIVRDTSINENLDIISCGAIPENPSELLENIRLELLIDELSANYENIIIDSPPLRLVSDALVVSRVVDNTLYLVRQGFTSKDEIAFIKNIDKEHKLPNLNLVFNGINKNKFGYGYNYDNAYYGKESRTSTFSDRLSSFLTRF